MKRKSKTFSYDGTTYEAREMTYAVVREVQRLLAAGQDSSGVIIAGCVFLANGTPLCVDAAAADALPVSAVAPLLDEVMRVSGMAGASAGAKDEEKTGPLVLTDA